MARYLWLLNNIAEAGERGISREEINRKWVHCIYNDNHESEIPRKTFYNYKCEIEALFGITLESRRIDGHFRYRIADEDSIEVGQVKRLLLNSLSINEAVSRGGELADRILLEDIPSSGGAALGSVIEAIRTSRALEIVHKSFKKGAEANVSVVYPFCLKLREQRWYVLAYKPSESDARVYGLDRIGQCRVLEEEFNSKWLREYFRKEKKCDTAADYFRDYYGVLIDDTVPLMDVTVRVFTGQYVNYFRSLPLHDSQVEVATVGEGGESVPVAAAGDVLAQTSGDAPVCAYSDFAYHIHPTIDFTRKLLSYGQYVKVLSPAEYAAEVGEMVRLAVSNYE